MLEQLHLPIRVEAASCIHEVLDIHIHEAMKFQAQPGTPIAGHPKTFQKNFIFLIFRKRLPYS
jgi:hypothetical protein